MNKPNAIAETARQLRDLIDAQHAARVGETLGCAVVILRRVPVQRNGKFTGITEPVFGMAPEFIEQAQILGLLAEGCDGRAILDWDADYPCRDCVVAGA